MSVMAGTRQCANHTLTWEPLNIDGGERRAESTSTSGSRLQTRCSSNSFDSPAVAAAPSRADDSLPHSVARTTRQPFAGPGARRRRVIERSEPGGGWPRPSRVRRSESIDVASRPPGPRVDSAVTPRWAGERGRRDVGSDAGALRQTRNDAAKSARPRDTSPTSAPISTPNAARMKTMTAAASRSVRRPNPPIAVLFAMDGYFPQPRKAERHRRSC